MAKKMWARWSHPASQGNDVQLHKRPTRKAQSRRESEDQLSGCGQKTSLVGQTSIWISSGFPKDQPRPKVNCKQPRQGALMIDKAADWAQGEWSAIERREAAAVPEVDLCLTKAWSEKRSGRSPLIRLGQTRWSLLLLYYITHSKYSTSPLEYHSHVNNISSQLANAGDASALGFPLPPPGW